MCVSVYETLNVQCSITWTNNYFNLKLFVTFKTTLKLKQNKYLSGRMKLILFLRTPGCVAVKHVGTSAMCLLKSACSSIGYTGDLDHQLYVEKLGSACFCNKTHMNDFANIIRNMCVSWA